ncbi:DHA2 family efflux MFS transporter permease subunit [Sphingomonas sp. GlSt437]|uniref:DHA2 family efflux MFS transporter permease subunit n=1 Tax=Sphingomonas sp. GlSt437 TaxID=3389970 RepID=UPI003A89F810
MTDAPASTGHGLDPCQSLKGPALLFAGLALALANFMVVLDTTIANVSVPNIAGGLAVSPDQGTWVITSYSVAEAITVPLTGWLARRFGPVKVFSLAMVSFAFWSAACGLAPSLGFLVVCRVMQGLSGGPMIPLSQTLLLRVFPPERQAAAIGLWAMTTVVAPIAGPILGGTLCDNWGWPWIFYINVAPALLCAGYVWRSLQLCESKPVRIPVDRIGLALLIVWVGAMQVMLDQGKDLDWFGSPFIVTLALIALIGFAAFVIWELTDANPIVDLRVFRHRGFTAGAVTIAIGYGAFFSSIVLIPLWLQTSLAYTATDAGYVMAWNGVLAVAFSPIVARLVTKFDPRALVSFGLAWMAGISIVRTGFTTSADYWTLSIPNLLQGIAVPFFFVPLTGLALSAVEPSETASAAGLMSFMRTTAGAFATSIITTAWDNGGTRAKSQLVGRVNDVQGFINNLGLGTAQGTGQVDQLVRTQATMISTDHMFLYSAFVLLFGAGLIWISPKPKGRVAAAAH